LAFADYRVALVTGASSGIGAATVRRLRAEGLEVHAMARDADRLATLAGETGCVAHALDVRSTAEIARLAGGLEVDVLVNNAGQSRQGDILSNTADDVDQLIDVNLRAILHLTRPFVPGMVARNRGHIVTISSIAGHYAFPGGNTVYHATKAGVHSLSQQLRIHLYGSRVRVTEISPARVETEVFARLLGDAEEAHKLRRLRGAAARGHRRRDRFCRRLAGAHECQLHGGAADAAGRRRAELRPRAHDVGRDVSLTGGSMELARLKALIDMVSRSKVSELEITEGGVRVRITRSLPAPVRPPAPIDGARRNPPAPRPLPDPSPVPAPTESQPDAHAVTSPTFGIFHRAASPESAPYVQPGSPVRAGDTLCLIEAMKSFSAIAADRDGTVSAILVENGQEVEPGQILIQIGA
jgi:acetyl-CoA carboxylase biotin carboxyl carrier protein